MPNYNDNPNMVPLMRMSPFMKDYMTPMKRYASPDNASPMNKLEDLSGDGKITKKDVLIGRGVIDKEGKGLSRKNKFCGGMSKPYGRKK